MSGWFQEKPKAEEAQDSAIAAKDQAGSFLAEKTQAVTTAASDTAESGKKMAGEAMGKASDTAQGGKDSAVESKDKTGGFFGEKTEAAKKAGIDTADAAKEKANETAQYAQDRASDAAEYTKAESPVVPKETTGNVFQQAGGQVMGAAGGAKDAVMNTLGMGGDK